LAFASVGESTRQGSAETTKPRLRSQKLTTPDMAAMAARRVTMADASLTRLSPSRIVTTRRGIPTRRAMAMPINRPKPPAK